MARYFDKGSAKEPDEGSIPNVLTVLEGVIQDGDDKGPRKGKGDQREGNLNKESNKQDMDEDYELGEDNGDDMEEEFYLEDSDEISNDEDNEL